MKLEEHRIPIEECIARHVYRIHARNLKIGVFNGVSGFYGIRTKFDSQFIDCEAHFDRDGTVYPLEDLGVVLPDSIAMTGDLGTADYLTDRLVAYNGTGWYFLDTGESSNDIKPYGISNKALFDFLKALR